jgi:hypothetical protein
MSWSEDKGFTLEGRSLALDKVKERYEKDCENETV